MGNKLIKYEEKLPSGEVKYLLPEIVGLFNCYKCGWRSTNDCLYYSEEDGQKFPEGNICNKRTNWLLGFARPYKEKPSHSQLVLDFKKAFGTAREMQEYKDLNKYKKVLDKRVDECLFDETTDKLQKLVQQKQSNWNFIWKTITELEDKQVTRETPKKVEIEHKRTPTPEEFAEWVNKPKTVDIEVINDEKSNNSTK